MHVPAGSGPAYFGPGDRVEFLATSADTRGSCFLFVAMVAPGGGPPPHIHKLEDESFFILEGTLTFHAGGRAVHAKPGDFIRIPRGTVHSLKNEGTVPGRALVIISPAGPTGLQRFFEESFYPAPDRNAMPPPISDELVKRMMAASPSNGLEWVKPA